MSVIDDALADMRRLIEGHYIRCLCSEVSGHNSGCPVPSAPRIVGVLERLARMQAAVNEYGQVFWDE